MIPMSDVLRKTQSVCPVCLVRIDGEYRVHDGLVWLEKTCPRHGLFRTPVWRDAAHFIKWQAGGPVQPPENPALPVRDGCPFDCGLCQDHRQAGCCVLLEVTSRCNLACPVCFASAQGTGTCPDPDLKVIAGWYDMLMERGGPFNIQLSGGEPTMRTDLPEIIRLGREKGFSFFQLNTNGIRLAQDEGYVQALREAGLSTVFLQFDSLQADANRTLRGQDLRAVKTRAIENCAGAGVGVVLVPTVKPGCNDGELWQLLEFAAERLPAVRGVHFQPISYFGRYGPAPEERMTLPDLLQALERQSGGKIRAAQFAPGGAEHPMCSFHADYEVGEERWTLVKSQSGCQCAGASRPSSERARKAVALKWSAPYKGADRTKSRPADSLDAFLAAHARKNLAVSGMAFQDAWTLDLDRLKRCHVHVVSPAGSLVPFCAYNLTAQDGRTLYRGRTE